MAPQSTTPQLWITALGLTSSLGFDAANACAASRAGLTRISEIKSLNYPGEDDRDEILFTGHVVPSFGEGRVGPARILSLGELALADLLRQRPLTDEEVTRTAFVLGVSDYYLQDHAADLNAEGEDQEDDASADDTEGGWDDDTAEDTSRKPSEDWHAQSRDLAAILLDRAELHIPQAHRTVKLVGHAGLAEPIARAAAEIESGRFDRCIVGGVESCVEPRFLVAAEQAGLVRTPTQPAGFIPGEAAAFVLLERERGNDANSDAPVVRLGCLVTEREAVGRLDEKPADGAVLASLLSAVTPTDVTPPEEAALAGFLIGDLNGDAHRAMEWGQALARLQGRSPVTDWPLWLPAASFGEVGAATIPLAICIAARAFQRGYAPAPSALVWVAGHDGERAAFAIAAHVD